MRSIPTLFLAAAIALVLPRAALAIAECPTTINAPPPIVVASWDQVKKLMCDNGGEIRKAHDQKMALLRSKAAPYMARQVSTLENYRDKYVTPDRELRGKIAAYNVERRRIMESGLPEKKQQDLRDKEDFDLFPLVRRGINSASAGFRKLGYAKTGEDDSTWSFHTWLEAPWFFLNDTVDRATVVACTYFRLDDLDAGQLSMCSTLDLETGEITGNELESAVAAPEAIKNYDDFRSMRMNPPHPIPEKPFYRMNRNEYFQSVTHGMAPLYCY